MTSVQYPNPWMAATPETMTYNVNGQMTSRNWRASSPSGYTTTGLSYSYSATQNNGQITHMTDTLSGETVGSVRCAEAADFRGVDAEYGLYTGGLDTDLSLRWIRKSDGEGAERSDDAYRNRCGYESAERHDGVRCE
jgi:hypothetical protein